MSLPSQSHARSMPEFEHDDEFVDHEPPEHNRRLQTRRLMLDLLGRWYWIVLGLVLGVLAASYYLSKAPEIFTATSTLLIKQQTATLMSRDQVEEIDMRSTEGLNTAAERMRRFEFLERVAARPEVRALDGIIPPPTDWRPAWLAGWFDGEEATAAAAEAEVPPPPPPPAALAGRIGSWMQVSVRRGTRLMDVSINHQVPEVAEVVANAIIHEYIAEAIGSVTEGRTSTSETLLAQSEEARTRLQAAESALATYNRALELHKALEAQENAVSQLSRRYLAKHPSMIAATGELNDLKTRFLDEFAFAMHSPADEAYWRTAGTQIEAAKDDPEARLRLARQLLLARTGVLRGEINSQMTVFNTMLTRVEETNVNLLGEQAGAEIHNLARTPGIPSAPNRQKMFMTGAVGGSGFGLAIAFLLVRLDNKFNTVAQVEEETGLPVLAAIADIDEGHLRQAVRAHVAKHPEETPDPHQEHQELWDPRLIFRTGTSHTNYAEMLRVLRASITLLGDESKRKITIFSSALPGEGKSLVSSNFALAAAGQGRKTLLIDLDLRKPRLHRIFGILRAKQGPGITDWLAGGVNLDDTIRHETGADNLHIILSGTRAPNPGELLNGTRIRQLFDEACEQYDTIVVDTAPLLAVPDTRVIAPLADNFCLVVRANYVPKGAVLRTLELLATADTPPSGLIFNGFKETRRLIGQNYSYGGYRLNRYGSPYKYGYGAYGAYGSDNDDDEATEKEILKRRKKSNPAPP